MSVDESKEARERAMAENLAAVIETHTPISILAALPPSLATQLTQERLACLRAIAELQKENEKLRAELRDWMVGDQPESIQGLTTRMTVRKIDVLIAQARGKEKT